MWYYWSIAIFTPKFLSILDFGFPLSHASVLTLFPSPSEHVDYDSEFKSYSSETN